MYIGNAFESMSEHFQWLTMSTGWVGIDGGRESGVVGIDGGRVGWWGE